MGKTSSEVKNRYNSKSYDIVRFAVKKGMNEKIKSVAETRGVSASAYIKDLIERDSGLDL